MMAQSTTAGIVAKSKYLNLEQTQRYQKIVSDLKTEKDFSVLGFGFIYGGKQSGHAIVARSIEQKNYYDAVLWAAEKGITGGTSATTFSPNDSCTRGQTVTFLWRYAGEPKAAAGANPFGDVDAQAYYYNAVLWAAEKGITGGTSATTFSPADTVTRAQTVTFLYRSQGE